MGSCCVAAAAAVAVAAAAERDLGEKEEPIRVPMI